MLISQYCCTGGISSVHEQIYFPEPTHSPDSKSLEIWLQSQEAHSRKILLVLDDLDGIDVSLRKRIRRHLATTAVNLIFSTRDPLLFAKGGDWDAISFELPPLLQPAAMELTWYLMSDVSSASDEDRASQAEESDVSRFAERLERSPAAIIIGCGFAKTHHVLYSVDECLRQFLDNWAPKNLIMYRWDDMTYPYTLRRSFELSMSRLFRNTSGNHDNFEYGLCILCLQVLSFFKLQVIKDGDLNRLCTYFESLLEKAAENFVPTWELKALTMEHRLRACITELTRVSLLQRSDHNGIKLEALTGICALQFEVSAPYPSVLRNYIEQHPLI